MKSLKISFFVLFAIIEIVFLVLVQVLRGEIIPIIEYISIALCFAYSLIFIKSKKLNFIISIALAFSLCADACLVLANPIKQLLGTSFFLVAQIVYCVYIILKTQNKKINVANIIARVCGSGLIILITYLVLKQNFDALSAVSIIYIFNLLLNIIFSFFTFGQNKCFSIGLILFFVCDIFIGLSAANGAYFTISNQAISSFINGPIAWLFYIPSQTLLAFETSCDYSKKL